MEILVKIIENVPEGTSLTSYIARIHRICFLCSGSLATTKMLFPFKPYTMSAFMDMDPRVVSTTVSGTANVQLVVEDKCVFWLCGQCFPPMANVYVISSHHTEEPVKELEGYVKQVFTAISAGLESYQPVPVDDNRERTIPEVVMDTLRRHLKQKCATKLEQLSGTSDRPGPARPQTVENTNKSESSNGLKIVEVFTMPSSGEEEEEETLTPSESPVLMMEESAPEATHQSSETPSERPGRPHGVTASVIVSNKATVIKGPTRNDPATEAFRSSLRILYRKAGSLFLKPLYEATPDQEPAKESPSSSRKLVRVDAVDEPVHTVLESDSSKLQPSVEKVSSETQTEAEVEKPIPKMCSGTQIKVEEVAKASFGTQTVIEEKAPKVCFGVQTEIEEIPKMTSETQTEVVEIPRATSETQTEVEMIPRATCETQTEVVEIPRETCETQTEIIARISSETQTEVMEIPRLSSETQTEVVSSFSSVTQTEEASRVSSVAQTDHSGPLESGPAISDEAALDELSPLPSISANLAQPISEDMQELQKDPQNSATKRPKSISPKSMGASRTLRSKFFFSKQLEEPLEDAPIDTSSSKSNPDFFPTLEAERAATPLETPDSTTAESPVANPAKRLKRDYHALPTDPNVLDNSPLSPPSSISVVQEKNVEEDCFATLNQTISRVIVENLESSMEEAMDCGQNIEKVTKPKSTACEDAVFVHPAPDTTSLELNEVIPTKVPPPGDAARPPSPTPSMPPLSPQVNLSEPFSFDVPPKSPPTTLPELHPEVLSSSQTDMSKTVSESSGESFVGVHRVLERCPPSETFATYPDDEAVYVLSDEFCPVVLIERLPESLVEDYFKYYGYPSTGLPSGYRIANVDEKPSTSAAALRSHNEGSSNVKEEDESDYSEYDMEPPVNPNDAFENPNDIEPLIDFPSPEGKESDEDLYVDVETISTCRSLVDIQVLPDGSDEGNAEEQDDGLSTESEGNDDNNPNSNEEIFNKSSIDDKGPRAEESFTKYDNIFIQLDFVRFKCKLCGKVVLRSRRYDHKMYHFGGQIVKCEWCDESYSVQKNLTRHTQLAHQDVFFAEYNKDRSVAPNRFKRCVRQVINDHIVQKKSGYRCTLCWRRATKRKETVRSHILQKHVAELGEKLKELIRLNVEIPMPNLERTEGARRSMRKRSISSLSTIEETQTLGDDTGAKTWKADTTPSLLQSQGGDTEGVQTNMEEVSDYCPTIVEIVETQTNARNAKPNGTNRRKPVFFKRQHVKKLSQVNSNKRVTLRKVAFPQAMVKFECDFCKKMFRKRSERTIHRRTHTGEKPFTCRHCGQCFGAKCIMHRHIYERHRAQLFSHCRKEGVSLKDFEKAIRLIMSVQVRQEPGRMIRCLYCNQEFARIRTANAHVITKHAEEIVTQLKEYQKNPRSLQVMESPMTGMIRKKKSKKKDQRPSPGVVCSICGSSFINRIGLGNHMKIHSGIKVTEL